MTSSLSPSDPLNYRRRARGIVFLAGLCLTAGVFGLTTGGAGASTLVGRELAQVAQTGWLLLYALGGALVIAGVYWPRLPRPELEVLGLWPLMGGFTINLLVIVTARGIPEPGTMPAIASLILAVWLAHGRALDLEEARNVARPDVDDRRSYDLGPRARAQAPTHRDERQP